MKKRLSFIIVTLLSLPVFVFADVDGDSDANGYLDVAKGGTNSATVVNARTSLGVPATATTLVGSCTVGPCLDGTSDGGDLIKLYGPSGFWTSLQAGNAVVNRNWRLPIDAPPAAGTTRLINVDENTQMGLVDPATFAEALGTDDNYVTDAEKTVIGNTSGTNTGDQTSASALTVTATGFDGNLTITDDTVQEVAQKLDDLSVTGGYTNLTSFLTQTAWRMFYSDGSGDVKELALGSDGEYLKSNGAAVAPSWSTPSGAAHDAVTLGDPTNGLSLATQQLSLGLASAGVTGALSGTDWSTFNNKQAALTNPIVAAGAQSITGAKTFDPSMLKVKGSSTGVTSIDSTNSSATNYTLSLPAADGTLARLSDITGTNSGTNTGDDATNSQYSGLITSKTANYIYAAPNGSAGVPSFRAMVAADVPTLNQNTTGTAAGLSGTPNITVGTISAGAAGFTIDADGDMSVKSISTTAADGSRRSIIPNNTSIAPLADGSEEIYNEGGALKAVENDTEYDIILSRDIGGAVQAYDADLDDLADGTLSESKIDAAIARDTEVRAKYVSGTEADFYGTLLDPQAIYAVSPSVTLINDVPAAFTITEISVSCDANPTTETTFTFQHKAAGIGYGTPTTIEAVLTVNGAATITSGIDDTTIPAGTKVFVTLSDPDDALNECSWQIEGDWD